MTEARNVLWKRRVGELARAALDLIARLTPRRPGPSPRRRIGVFLYWGIGDAVLGLPLLQALRDTYPDAHITALGKPWLIELFGDEGLFDAYFDIVPPWTRHRGKYNVWDADWRRFLRLLRQLRRNPFDLLISPRPDPREVVMARLLGGWEYAGLASMGGAGWISVDLGAGMRNAGQAYDGAVAAAAAKALLGVEVSPMPRFRRLARRPAEGLPVLAVSFGASHPIKRWNEEGIAGTLSLVRRKPASTLVISHQHSPTVRLPEGWERRDWQGSLAELKALLAGVDVMFCSDSGVMHIAAACGCRVVALFTTGMLSRFGPMGQRVYAVEPMPCRPCGDYCIHPTLRCVEGIEAAAVAMLVEDALRESAPRIDVTEAPSGTP